MSLRRILPALLLAAGLVLGGSAQAVPVVITAGDLLGTEALIDFESGTAGDEILGSLAGVTFSNGIFFDATQAPPFMGTGQTATNFTSPSFSITSTIMVTFDSAVSHFAFDAITNDGDDLDITVFSVGGGSTVFNFNTSLTPSFVGVQDLDGILGFQIAATTNVNGAFAIDNLRVPEPRLLALVGIGGLALAGSRRRPTSEA